MKSHHIDDLLKRAPALESCIDSVQRAYEVLHNAYLTGNKLLLCGNGGSAADSEHWAGELMKGFMLPRKLPQSQCKGLPADLSENLQWGLPAIPLTGFPAYASAFANDVKPELIFAQLTWVLGKPCDVLVAISTSGNSKNVCQAARVAQFRGMRVIALTGESGGTLRGLSDVCVAVPSACTPLIQEYHLPIYHCLSLMLEDAWEEIHSAPRTAASQSS